jgi:DNA polymerase-3 subunit alpha
MQEPIMQFLVKFCGYSSAESDNVRRGIAKKKGTEQLLPEIER